MLLIFFMVKFCIFCLFVSIQIHLSPIALYPKYWFVFLYLYLLRAHLNRYAHVSDFQLWVWTTTTNSSTTMPFTITHAHVLSVWTDRWSCRSFTAFGSFHRWCLRANASDMQQCWCTWAKIHTLILQSLTYSHAPKWTIPRSQTSVNISYG